MADPGLQRDLFLLIGYLLSSAHGLYQEPAGYGPFRLIDAARRLLALMAEHGLSDPYLAGLHAGLEAACTGTASDEELCALVNRLVVEFAGEVDRRLAPADSSSPGAHENDGA